MAAGIEDKIKALEEKLKQAKAQKSKIDARKKAIDAKAQRRQDTRRKILVGAAILAKVDRGEWPNEKLLAILETTLTRDDDRALFGLKALVSENSNEETSEL